MSQKIVASDGQLWTLPEFVMSPEDAAERDALLNQRYFLVRQGSLGEIFRCRECKGKHAYFTLRCHERPFPGIYEGLWAYYEVAGTPEAFVRMTPAERTRVEQVKRLFGAPDPARELTAGHPETARAQDVAARDIFRGAYPMGVLEEIPRSLAQRFVDLINTELPADARLRLPGLTA